MVRNTTLIPRAMPNTKLVIGAIAIRGKKGVPKRMLVAQYIPLPQIMGILPSTRSWAKMQLLHRLIAIMVM